MCLCSRYTSHLLTKAKHVTAVDFMESFVKKNRENNGHHSNVTFVQADVTKLEIPKNRWVKCTKGTSNIQNHWHQTTLCTSAH